MDWHRLFGLVLTDHLSGTPFIVELEKDLSFKKQYLDVVIVRKTAGVVPFRLPDGLDDLVDHNLITFKSHHEPFDAWAVKEVMAHYVNYRKQVSPSLKELIPEAHFRCFGACARFPTQLQGIMTVRQQGVWECPWVTDVVRVLVLRDLPREEHNAPLHLFSAAREQVQYGQVHYRQRSPDTNTLVGKLLDRYKEEGLQMPYTMEDFRREAKKDALRELTPDERLEGLPPEKLLEKLTPEERLEGLPPEKLLEKLSPEKRLESLSLQEIENYLRRMKDRSQTHCEE
jgi:hypothetical protein